MGLLTAEIVDQAVAFQQAVRRFLFLKQPPKQGCGGVPTVYEHRAAGNATRGQVGQHIGHRVEGDFAVGFGSKQVVVQKPELVGFRVDIHAGNQADADNHAVDVAVALVAHQRNAPAVVSVEHRIVE